jgi:hypothetical protein
MGYVEFIAELALYLPAICFFITQVPIAEAMRELLESFRLPGEAQQIERITDTFAAKYFNSQPGLLLLMFGSQFC